MTKYGYSKYVRIIFLSADLLCLNTAVVIANYFHSLNIKLVEGDNLFYLLILNALWISIFFFSNQHKVNREFGLLDYINRVLSGLIIKLSIVFAIWFVVEVPFTRRYIFYILLIFSCAIVFWRMIWYLLVNYFRARGFNYKNVIIVGNEEISERLSSHFQNNPGYGYKILNIPSDQSANKLHEVMNFVSNNKVDIIFFFLPTFDRSEINQLITFSESNLIKLKIMSQFSLIDNKNLLMQRYGDVSVINLGAIPLDKKSNQFIKRLFDLIFASLVIIFIFSWLVPVLGILIKLESKGPIFFKQDRTGKGNTPFKCLKFRTMIVNELADIQQATKNDPRITKIGAILRKTSIDELPQFINVFKGDMSVVGPRPHRMKLNDEFSDKIDKFNQRHAVKPGITGLAQAKGFRGETAELSDMSGRVKLDRFYVKNWSLILDLKIIVLTAMSIIKGDQNAY